MVEYIQFAEEIATTTLAILGPRLFTAMRSAIEQFVNSQVQLILDVLYCVCDVNACVFVASSCMCAKIIRRVLFYSHIIIQRDEADAIPLCVFDPVV